ncbi:MAG: hypothetical protein WCP16_04805 [Pseudanabaena sp. ELA645]|jgi:hypothetical protein
MFQMFSEIAVTIGAFESSGRFDTPIKYLVFLLNVQEVESVSQVEKICGTSSINGKRSSNWFIVVRVSWADQPNPFTLIGRVATTQSSTRTWAVK